MNIINEKLLAVLSEKSIFSYFSTEELDKIITFSTVEHYSFGQYIVKEGEQANCFYFIYSGKVKIQKKVGSKDVIVGTICKGDHFGEKCLVEDSPRIASVLCAEESLLIKFPKQMFLQFIENHPEIRSYIHNYLRDITFRNFIRLSTAFGVKIPLKHMNEIISNFKPERFKAGEYIFRQGEPGDKFYLIRKGVCEVIREEDGTHISLTKLEDGKFFGEKALMEEHSRWGSVKSLTDSTLYSLSKENFFQLQKKAPAVTTILQKQIQIYKKRAEHLKDERVEDHISAENIDIDTLIRNNVEKIPDQTDDNEDQERFKPKAKKIKWFPSILQHDITDCGAASLAMICRYYGKKVSQSYLRDISNITAEGSSMLSVAHAAEKVGFFTRGLKLDIEGLSNVLLPAICHWGGYHWVVVYAVDNNTVYVSDPAVGKVTYTKEEFVNHWTGMALLLDKGPDFSNEAIGKSSIGHFLPVVLEYKKYIIDLFVITLVLTIFGLATPFFTQIILDDVLVNRDYNLMTIMIIGMIILFVFQNILAIVKSYLAFHISTRINLKLFVGFFHHLTSLPLLFFKKRRIGDITARFDENSKIQNFLLQNSITVIIDIFSMFIYLIVMFSYSSTLTLVFLSFISILVLITLAITPKLKRMTNDIFESGAEESSQLIETLHGIDTIKAMGLEASRRWIWESKFLRNLHFIYRQFKWETALGVTLGSITFASSTTILYFGALQVMKGNITIGQLMAFTTLAGAFMGPITKLVGLWDEIQEVKVALERLADVFNSEPETAAQEDQKVATINQINGLVEFENVNFSYGKGDDAPLIINNFSLTAFPGQLVAIVGRSGSGKTTLIKMLPRLLTPDSGVLRIDGVDINNLDLMFLRSNIGFVMQDCFIFSGTIFENIAMNRSWITMDAAIEAAKLANAHDFIIKMTGQYNTVIGEKGIDLSGGQKQRISIARQLVANPKIMILDEATSALDTESEMAIQANLSNILKGRTTFIIAHRLSTVKNADHIIVLDAGSIVEQGRHVELMENKNLYYHLNTAQLNI